MQRHQLLPSLSSIAVVAGCRRSGHAGAAGADGRRPTHASKARSWATTERRWKRRSIRGARAAAAPAATDRQPPRRRRTGPQRTGQLRRQARRHPVGHRQGVLARSVVLARDLAGQPPGPESAPHLPGRYPAPGVHRRAAAIVLQPGLERGDAARVMPRVRSQPLEGGGHDDSL